MLRFRRALPTTSVGRKNLLLVRPQAAVPSSSPSPSLSSFSRATASLLPPSYAFPLLRPLQRFASSAAAANATPTAATTQEAVDPLCRIGTVVDYGSPAQNLLLGTGVLARQCDGSAIGRQGGSLVLATAVSSRQSQDSGDDFLPLVVEYREKAHAFGRINRSINRREGAQTDQEILASRVVDRVIRPLFPEGYFFDTQIVTTVESADKDTDLSVLAVNTASAALSVSDIPWNGPVGCVRVGMDPDGKLLINPTEAEMATSRLNLLYAGNERRTLMIEAGANEVPEKEMVKALKFAHFHCGSIIQAQRQLMDAVDVRKRKVPDTLPSKAMWAKAEEVGYEEAVALFSDTNLTKSGRSVAEGKLHEVIRKALREEFPECHPLAPAMCSDKILRRGLRDAAMQKGVRCDGRSFTDIRHITAGAAVLPSVHGSAVFSRGDTQVLCAVTLGSEDDAIPPRFRDEVEANLDLKKAFLHYDFPPYCVNETGKVFGSNRRMVGHGALAERAILPVLPSPVEFPYTIRVSSEVTGSNGSSSMASACGASLALMDAGVPIKGAVAGVSVGLLSPDEEEEEEEEGETPTHYLPEFAGGNEGEEEEEGREGGGGGKIVKKPKKPLLLVDILGTEDHYGDMDFKVAGTEKGITAIQLDIKLAGGVHLETLVDGLHEAGRKRKTLLQIMNKTIRTPHKHLKATAPGMEVVTYDFEQHKEIFTLENRRQVEDEYGVRLSFPERGKVTVFGRDPNKVAEAHRHVQELVADIREGEVYTATVVEVKDFGAVVEVLRGKEGLLHMSEISHAKGGKAPKELLAVGQQVKVKCLAVDRMRGLIKLSRKALMDPKEKDDIKPDMNAAGLLLKVPVPPGSNFTHLDLRKQRAGERERARSSSSSSGSSSSGSSSSSSGSSSSIVSTRSLNGLNEEGEKLSKTSGAAWRRKRRSGILAAKLVPASPTVAVGSSEVPGEEKKMTTRRGRPKKEKGEGDALSAPAAPAVAAAAAAPPPPPTPKIIIPPEIKAMVEASAEEPLSRRKKKAAIAAAMIEAGLTPPPVIKRSRGRPTKAAAAAAAKMAAATAGE